MFFFFVGGGGFSCFLIVFFPFFCFYMVISMVFESFHGYFYGFSAVFLARQCRK